MPKQNAPATSPGAAPGPGAKRRTRAHDAKELAAALGWSPEQFSKATVAGVIPGPDMKTPRWSGALVEDLVSRRDQLAADIPDLVDGDELMGLLGVSYGEWVRGLEHGAIPRPDVGTGWWSRGMVDDLAGRAEKIRAAIPPAPLGARRTAEILAGLVKVDVTGDDIEELARRGLTAVVGYYKKWPLYDVGALMAAAATGEGQQAVIDVVGDRQAWLAGSLTSREAAAALGCREHELERIAGEHSIVPGRFGRWPRAAVAGWTGDEDLMERVRREQLLGPRQAADHMEIRPIDFAYVRAACWAEPVTHVERVVGTRKTVDVPLFTIGALEDALAMPGVDWEAVRAVRPGAPSPLQEWTRLPVKRAEAVRAFCTQLAEEWSVEVWPRFWNATDTWEIDWETRADGHPTLPEVQAALAEHPGAGPYASSITLSTAVGEVIRTARECLEMGAAVIVDTETTGLDGVVIEISVCDVTGEVLLDTLVHPDGVPIEEAAAAVHGIPETALADAPRWADVAPRFLAAVGGARVLAYNADFDRDRIAATHAHAGLDPATLPGKGRWWCLMEARSTWARTGQRIPLNGPHAAAGDAQAALDVLHELAASTTT